VRAPLQRCITGGYHVHILGEDEVLSLPGLRSYGPSRHDQPPFTVFRAQFDAWFAEEAVRGGAELFTATLVEDLLWENGRVAGVRTRRGDLRARVVIGADGVNSTVGEKSGLMSRPSPSDVSLIVREILDLSAERIEERFGLQPGQGLLTLFIGLIEGFNGRRGIYYTELYTNQDSLSLTAEVQLNVLSDCGVPAYEVLAAREQHPSIAHLIRGAKLREYQAHLLPRGGLRDLSRLWTDGVLLTGDAGRFVDKHGVGSWPAMASGVAAARAVRYACDKGDFSKQTLAVYQELLDEEGLLETQREARQAWDERQLGEDILHGHPDRILHLARRYFDEWIGGPDEHPLSVWGEAYHELVKPAAPWHLRLPLGFAAWIDTRAWRRRRKRR
jgi:electron transfer flavoprotein-quinone oxidoreductase